MKTSKEAIFEALRSSGAEEFSMPDLGALEAGAMVFENPLEAFCNAVRTAGGKIEEAVIEAEDSFTVDGAFGVAENGAVWIDKVPESAGRVDLFIHEKLIVRLPKDQIVNNMHEAYSRIGEKASGYGIFISGPSKTADIEQALVFGAHGPKELSVVLSD